MASISNRFSLGYEEIGYEGYFTIHQAQGIETAAEATAFARRCADYVNAQS